VARVTITQHPRPGQNYGPGIEPQGVRDAWDAYLHGTAGEREEAEPQPEARHPYVICMRSVRQLLNLPVFVRVIPPARYQ
jgi:hypothetical protein